MAAEVSNRIGHWADALRHTGNKELARQLVTDNGTKPEVLERLRAAGLPVQPSKLINLGAFRDDPSQHLEAFRSPLYWISLLPPDPSQQKYSISGVNAQEVLDFVKTYGQLPNSYAILLNFFEENVYGGQVMSNKHVVCIEMGAFTDRRSTRKTARRTF